MTVGALAKQNRSVVKYFRNALEKGEGFNFDFEVQSRPSGAVLIGCSFSSFLVVGFLILLDAGLSRCYGHQPTTEQNLVVGEEMQERGIMGRIRRRRETSNTAMTKGDNDQANNNANYEEENAESRSGSTSNDILPSWTHTGY